MSNQRIERRSSTWDEERRPWKLYYCVSKPNQLGIRYLLYVGITSQGFDRSGNLRRWKEHESDALEFGNKKILWWAQVDQEYSKQFIRDYSAAFKSEAEEVEKLEIRRLKPKYNTAGHVKPAFGVYRPFNPKLVTGERATAAASNLDGSKVFYLTVLLACFLLLTYWAVLAIT